MTAPQYLERARELDADIQRIDRLYVAAVTSDAHPRLVNRLLSQRNELTRQWSEAWGCRKVES